MDGYPEEHFLDIFHVEDVDAPSITQALTSFMEEKNFDYRRLVGQCYNGAATFSDGTNVSKGGLGHTQLMHCTYTVHPTDFSWHLFKLLTPSL